jgi:putative addiction module antidote
VVDPDLARRLEEE